MYIKQLTNKEFDDFSKSFKPGSVFQTKGYAFVMNEQKCDSLFVGLIDDNKIVAASLILIQKINGFKYAYAPRGFLIDYTDYVIVESFTKEVKKFLSKKDIVAVKINPLIIKNTYDNNGKIISKNSYFDAIFNNLKKLGYFHLGYNNYFEAVKPRFEGIINLNKDDYSLFYNIDKTFRTKIRGAEKEGIKVYRGYKEDLKYLYKQTKNKYPRDLKYYDDVFDFYNDNDLADFYYTKLDTNEYLKQTQIIYQKYERNCNEFTNKIIENSRKGIKNEKLISEKILCDSNFAQYKKQLIDATRYLRENPNGIILSTALVVRWHEEVYLLMDGYDETYKSFNAKHLLLWNLIYKYSKLGYKVFNLGGLINLDFENQKLKYKGLNEFKKKFGAETIEYIGDFELICNNAKYFMYNNSRQFSGLFNKKQQ